MNTREKLDTPSARTVESPSLIFDLPKVEIPTVFQDVAQRGIAQAQETLAKCRVAAEAITDVAEETFSVGAAGMSAYNRKIMESFRQNAFAGFDFAGDLMKAKSPSDAVSCSSGHLRKQFEAMMAQGKELAALAQKVATDTTEPIKAGMTKATKDASS